MQCCTATGASSLGRPGWCLGAPLSGQSDWPACARSGTPEQAFPDNVNNPAGFGQRQNTLLPDDRLVPGGLMTTGFHLQTEGLWNAAEVLQSNADLAATAGSRLLSLGEILSGPRVGVSLADTLQDFSAGWIGALSGVVFSVTELSLLVRRSANLYLTVDDDVRYQFSAVHE
jgi:hypothetical protein